MIRFHALGNVELTGSDGHPVRPVLVQPKRLALLAYLGCATPAGFQRRDRLLALLWPELDQRRARAALNTAVYQLRQALGPAAIVSRGTEDLGLGPDVWCDVMAFEEALHAGDAERALSLYRGELLSAFHLEGARDIERWLDERRADLRDQAVAAAWRLAGDAEAADDGAAAAHCARVAVGLAPYDEQRVRQLMALLERVGDRAGALVEYEEFAARLAAELDAQPAPATEALAESLRDAGAGGPAPKAEAAPNGGSGGERPSRGTPAAPEASGTARHGARRDAGAPGAAVRAARRWRPLRTAILVALAAPTALLLWGVVSRTGGTRTDGTFERVAVLPFTVSGRPDLDYLGHGMMDLLANSLDGAGRFRTLDPAALLAAAGSTSDLDDDLVAAGRLSATAYLVGSVTGMGDHIRVRASLHRLKDAQQVAAAAAQGDPDSLFQLVDQVTAELLAADATEHHDRLASVAARTTHSLAALKAYLDGERAFRAGRFVQAEDAFRRAATADTTFALAYYRESLASLWADQPQADPAEVDAHLVRHLDRLSPHDRLLVDGYIAWRAGRADSAEYVYRRVVAAYPADIEAWGQLGETLFHYNPVRGRPIAEAREAFDRVLTLDPDNWGARWHMAQLDALAGDRDAAVRDLQRLQQAGPGVARALEIRALLAFTRGGAGAKTRMLADLEDAPALRLWTVAWRLAVEFHDLDTAARIAELLTDRNRREYERKLGYTTLAWLDLARGHLAGARARADSLTMFVPKPWPPRELHALIATLPFAPASPATLRALRDGWTAPPPPAPDGSAFSVEARVKDYLMGIMSADLGDAAVAGEWADSLVQGGAVRGGDAVRAEMAWRDGHSQTVLRLLEAGHPAWLGLAASSPYWGHDRDRFRRAQMLEAAGRDRDALGWYEGFGEHALHDLVFLAPALLQAAHIHERLGEPRQAGQEYARVLELYRTPDSELRPAADSAAAALARLRGR